MNYEEIKDTRDYIAFAEEVRDKAVYDIEKSTARYLVKRLKAKLVNLIAGQPKQL